MTSNAIDVEGLALTSNLPDAIPDLLQTVASHGKDLIAQDPEARLKLLEAARSLMYALETPREAIIRHCWSEVCCHLPSPASWSELKLFRLTDIACTQSTSYAALETAVDMSLFSALGTDDRPKTVAELAEATRVDPFLLGHETEMGSFGHVQQEPLTAKQSNNHMSVYARCRVRWMDPGFYPVQEQLIAGVTISEDDVLLVDVAGSFGHDLSDFRRKWPGLPGRLVLQDLPEVMVSVKDLHPSIEVTSHDFFTERPVKGTEIGLFHVLAHRFRAHQFLEYTNIISA
ncbi:unnamed protein product [Penicillium egyptiacum]|uniref:O-methyltransferase domain-containing protein n=1 Tax=Penicillium egyptiacum TaxID=1303716 RepID=A0A9W4KD27_9EURO|nr:unnamed protein product [Penicillium egyptiacum]